MVTKVNIKKLDADPTVFAPNELYFIKNGSYLDIGLADSDGLAFYKSIGMPDVASYIASQKNTANGIAGLNALGELSTAVIPVTGVTVEFAQKLATGRYINGVLFDGSSDITIGLGSTATSLSTPRDISMTGDGTWTVTFDGSANVSAAMTLANSGVTAGTYNDVATQVRPFTVDAKGRITSIGAAVNISVPWGQITSTPTTLSGYGITDAIPSSQKGAASGVATLDSSTLVPVAQLPKATSTTLGVVKPGTGMSVDVNGALQADALATPRDISMTGDGTWTVSFDGSANVSAAMTLANSGVTAGTYNDVATEVRPFTVDAKGRITSIGAAVSIAVAWSNISGTPTTLSGYGITNAVASSEKGAASGVATLDSSTLVPVAQLPKATDTTLGVVKAGTGVSIDANGAINVTGGGGGGATITDDTTTNSNGYYPALATATSGSYSTAYVSSTKLYFNPSTGTLNSTEFNSLSDARYKDNIVPIDDPIAKLGLLNGYTFDFMDTQKPSVGLLAQEVEAVFPQLVSSDNGSKRKSLNYQGIIGLLVSAFNESERRHAEEMALLRQEIETLKTLIK